MITFMQRHRQFSTQGRVVCVCVGGAGGSILTTVDGWGLGSGEVKGSLTCPGSLNSEGWSCCYRCCCSSIAWVAEIQWHDCSGSWSLFTLLPTPGTLLDAGLFQMWQNSLVVSTILVTLLISYSPSTLLGVGAALPNSCSYPAQSCSAIAES